MASNVSLINHVPLCSNASLPAGDQRPARGQDRAQRQELSPSAAPPSVVVHLSDGEEKGGNYMPNGRLHKKMSLEGTPIAQGKESNNNALEGIIAASVNMIATLIIVAKANLQPAVRSGGAVSLGRAVSLGGALSLTLFSAVVVGVIVCKYRTPYHGVGIISIGSAISAGCLSGKEAAVIATFMVFGILILTYTLIDDSSTNRATRVRGQEEG